MQKTKDSGSTGTASEQLNWNQTMSQYWEWATAWEWWRWAIIGILNKNVQFVHFLKKLQKTCFFQQYCRIRLKIY